MKLKIDEEKVSGFICFRFQVGFTRSKKNKPDRLLNQSGY
ncbi:hypothetical protein BSF41_17280 [Flavobacterium sp. ACN2]|nr:hypothetical protein BSF41_17280 [Flavobacterium sp. ACN2]